MKNETMKLFPAYLCGLALMAAVTWLLTPLVADLHWIWVILSALLLCLGAVVCHVKSKHRTALYIIGYLLNAIGSGVAAATLYAQMEWSAEIMTPLPALAPAAVMGLLLCLGYFGQGKLWRKIWGLGMLLLALALIVLSVIVWINWQPVVGSMGFFSSICLLFFMMACLGTLDASREKWRYLSFSGFWAFAVIAVVVVLILSEGEILDGLDFDFSGGGESGKTKKRVK